MECGKFLEKLRKFILPRRTLFYTAGQSFVVNEVSLNI